MSGLGDLFLTEMLIFLFLHCLYLGFSGKLDRIEGIDFILIIGGVGVFLGSAVGAFGGPEHIRRWVEGFGIILGYVTYYYGITLEERRDENSEKCETDGT